MWGHMNEWGTMGSGMGLGMLVFWVMLGLGFALLVRYASGGGREKSALDILKERYARGEIGREEYEQMKRDLED